LKRIDELWEKVEMVLIQIVAASVVAGVVFGVFSPLFFGLALGRFTFSQLVEEPKSYQLVAAFLVGILAALWTVRKFLIAAKLYDEVRHWRFGLRGEQAVAEKLADRELAAAGY